MAHISLPHTIYKYSDVATIVDSASNYCIGLGIFGVVGGLLGGEILFCAIAGAAIGIGFLMKEYIAPEIAKAVFEKEKQKMIEARSTLTLQHIIPTRKIDNKTLEIKCPKCTQPVSIYGTCSCGCDIWKHDILFQKEIIEICKANNIEV